MTIQGGVLAAFTMLVALGACAQAPEVPETSAPARNATAAMRAIPAKPAVVDARAPSQRPMAANALPLVRVHKSASCGCCTVWVEHLQKSGFKVDVNNADNLEPIKKRLGIPFGKGSCHTAEIDGLFVEGHVPAADIKRLLADRGTAKGLVLPGMPAGSPGMEMPDGRLARYTVEKVNADGSTSPFATHGE